jgi:microcystin degradation protein MlrC
LTLSAFGVQCWLDIQEMGCSVLGVARVEAVERAREVVARTARAFWGLREVFTDFPFHSPEEAIRLGLASAAQPIVLNEPADNVGAGATGDSTSARHSSGSRWWRRPICRRGPRGREAAPPG